jgi:hypothetical protein
MTSAAERFSELFERTHGAVLAFAVRRCAVRPMPPMWWPRRSWRIGGGSTAFPRTLSGRGCSEWLAGCWPTRTGGYAAWVRDERLAYFYQPKLDTWSSVAQPDSPGALSGITQGELERSWYLTVAGMIAPKGHRYDPVAGLWSPTPALPVGAGDPVLAGDNSILACFGVTGEVFGSSCQLSVRRRPARPTSPGVVHSLRVIHSRKKRVTRIRLS